MNQAQRAELKAVLDKRISAVVRDEAAAEALREDLTLDQQSVGRLSRMDAIQRKAMADASAARRRAEILRLRAALPRVDDEDYGYCAGCGEEIPFARLKTDPSLCRCAECMRG